MVVGLDDLHVCRPCRRGGDCLDGCEQLEQGHSALALGPLLHAFGWTKDDQLAAGTLAGHLLECGANERVQAAWVAVVSLTIMLGLPRGKVGP